MIGRLFVIWLLLISANVQATQPDEFSLCLQSSEDTYSCKQKYFSTALQENNYALVRSWLDRGIIDGNDGFSVNEVLGMVVCGFGLDEQGNTPFGKGKRNEVKKTIGRLLELGASFHGMPHSQIVTPLFCVVNRQDSELLEFVLSRIQVQPEDLNASLYEGTNMMYVPLFRAVTNNDLESAKVLVQHGASLDMSKLNVGYGFAEQNSLLLGALHNKLIVMANWLLDMGVPVYEGDEGICRGKLPIDYAQVIPGNVPGRDLLIARIETQMVLDEGRCLIGVQ
ncbi:MAG: hypothetical protein ACPGSM_21325 [Thiolinea sp.]